MTKGRDDWAKPRSHGQHLTEAEKKRLEELFRAGEKYEYAARELKCSSRVASKYFSFFKAAGVPRGPSVPLRMRSPAVEVSAELKAKMMAGK